MKTVMHAWNLGLVLTLCVLINSHSSNLQAEEVIRKLQFDPAAKKVELFSGIDNGILDYKLVMKGMNEGNLIVENKTDEPITVELPASVVGVHVNPQTLNQIGIGAGGGGQQGGFGGGQQGFGGGGQQGVGGGFGGGGGFNNNGGGGGIPGAQGGGGGGGFFSIPAGRKALCPMQTVCLEHGKPNPTVKSVYKLVKVEEFTQDQRLRELINLVGTGKLDTASAQAASWHIANGLSWNELSDMRMGKLPQTRSIHMFTQAEIMRAQNIVATADGKAREVALKQKENPTATEPVQVKPVEPVSPRLQMIK